jgi:TetR/AcrR family transcriptional repressor of nem operon
MRARGVAGTGVSVVMREAGLTHGGFYAHFPSKAGLVAEALSTAMQTNRALWFNGLDDADDATWVEHVIRRYLSRTHRDGSAEGCPLPALSAEVSRESAVVRAAYEAELRKTVTVLESRLRAVTGERARDRALAVLALCVGGMLLARAVKEPRLSDEILNACRTAALGSPPSGGRRARVQ